jgi:glutaredoxin 3
MQQFTTTAAGPTQMAKEFVQTQISKFPVVTFTKSFCPHSQKVKSVFTQHQVQFQDFQLDGRPDMDAIQDVLKETTGARTVPRVFINGKFIGGGDDTVKLCQEGKLENLLASRQVRA